MILFLTSSPCKNLRPVPGCDPSPCTLNEENDFVKNLLKDWKPDSKGLIISSDPDNFERNDEMAATLKEVFSSGELSLSSMEVCDRRNESGIAALLSSSDFVILAGGHVPTQNAFFRRIGLPELIQDFKGIVLGISAGTMNSAATVYAQPELEGESLDPAYERFLPGLGLTDIMVLPHYQEVKDSVLDEKRVFEDITYPDSMGRRFYALIDGSYLLVRNGETTLHGEAYLIQDGEISKICSLGESVKL